MGQLTFFPTPFTTVFNSTDDPHLNALVNSMFDTYPSADIYEKLKALMIPGKSTCEWYVKIDDTEETEER